MACLYHITSRSHWLRAEQVGVYEPESLTTEGFIHCSTVAQVVKVANGFYQGQADLVLLCLDPTKIQAPLRYDPIATGEGFPHIYGALNLDAVVDVLPFIPDTNGLFSLPNAINPDA